MVAVAINPASGDLSDRLKMVQIPHLQLGPTSVNLLWSWAELLTIFGWFPKALSVSSSASISANFWTCTSPVLQSESSQTNSTNQECPPSQLFQLKYKENTLKNKITLMAIDPQCLQLCPPTNSPDRSSNTTPRTRAPRPVAKLELPGGWTSWAPASPSRRAVTRKERVKDNESKMKVRHQIYSNLQASYES